MTLLIVFLLALATIAAGCGTDGRSPADASSAKPLTLPIVPLPAALWTDEPLSALQSGEVTWHDPARGRTIRVRWAAPDNRAALGVVLLLPALGQFPETSDPLVRMLAGAGYAVIATGDQRPPGSRPLGPPGDPRPLPTAERSDPMMLPTPPGAAAGGDRPLPPRLERSAARGAFSAVAATDRLLDARFVMDHLERAAPFPLAADARSRIAVVGLELGAQTAQLLIGEQMQRQKSAAPDERIRAAVLLAPFASFEGPSFSQRYRAIAVPLLIVFGSRESDSHGLNITAAQRRQMVAAIEAPRFTVELADSSVTELFVRRTMEAPSDAPLRMRPPMGDASGGGAPGGRTGSAPPAGAVAGGPPPKPDMPGTISSTRASAAAVVAMRTTLLATRAFLDAELLGDKDAREWLERNSGASAGAQAGRPN